MNKDLLRGIVALAIVLVLYLMVVFLIPFVHTAVFWISFVFTLLAFFVTAGVFYMALMRGTDAKSRFFGFPIAKIGVLYAIVQLICGVIVMALAAYVPVWAAMLLFAVILGVTLLGLLATDAAVEEIHVQDRQLKKNVFLMRDLQSKAAHIAASCPDPEAAAAVRRVAEELRYSDPVSAPALADIEQSLTMAVSLLQSAVYSGDRDAIRRQCASTSAILAERNRLCKLYKG